MKRNSGPIPLTKEGFERLKEELAKLKKDMPDLIDEAQRTAAYGDRSDNAEYKEAKSALRRAQGRIFRIEDQIKRIKIIEPEKNISGVVDLGSTVVVKSDGVEKTFQIVGPYETEPSMGRISHRSPLGSALMNRRKGDVVMVDLPGAGGNKEYRIVEIR